MARSDTTPAETVLVTGGSSGIGAGLASRFHARGAHVLIAGRDKDRLQAVADPHPGMETVVMDVADPASIAAAFTDVSGRVPHLTTLINNAGVQQLLDLTGDPAPTPQQVSIEIATNLAGLINVSVAALPLLRRATTGRIVHVGSGLGFVPLAKAPVYSATKAGVHSFTLSLRHQLRTTGIRVVEIVPPVVETGLHRDQSAAPPRAMALDTFLDGAMKGLDGGRDEFGVGLGNVLRIGSRVAPKRFLGIVNRQR